MIITHLIQRADWERAQAAGTYHAPSLDTEGFIHFSTPEQVARTATRFYAGVGGLALLVVETDKLTARLVFEAPSHPTHDGELFPHLYGDLNLDAVVRVIDYPPQPDGTFAPPEGID